MTAPTHNQNFNEWFKGSKAVDGFGNPAIFYHKSRSKDIFNSFTDNIQYLKNPFNDCGGIYFVGKGSEPNIDYIADGVGFYVYLKCLNPLIICEKIVFNNHTLKTTIEINDMLGRKYQMIDISKPFVNKCKEENYDSIFIYSHNSYNQFVVFENKQIKSIDNNGLYQNDNNIFS
jgi:hypothetical protein